MIDLERDMTVLVPTFERRSCLETLLDSLDEQLPGVGVLIADDSREPYAQEVARSGHARASAFALPHDSGVSAKRNRLIQRARTRWVLLADDDFVFGPDHGAHELVSVGEESGLHWIAGAAEEARGRRVERWASCFDQRERELRMVPVSTAAPLTLCDTTIMYAAARRDALAGCNSGIGPFDERFKTAPEHLDMHLTLRREGVRVASLSGPRVENRHGEDRAYRDEYRTNPARTRFDLLLSKWGLGKAVYPNGWAFWFSDDGTLGQGWERRAETPRRIGKRRTRGSHHPPV